MHTLGRTADASTLYHRALHLEPTRVDVRNNLGVALKAMGQYNAAEEVYREVIRMQPGHVNAYSNLVNLLAMQGRKAEAVDMYRKHQQLLAGLLKQRQQQERTRSGA